MSLLWLYSKKEMDKEIVNAEKKWINKGKEIGKRELLSTFILSWKSPKDIVRDNIDYFSWLQECDRYKTIKMIFWENIPKEWDEYFDVLKKLDHYEVDRPGCGLDPSIDCCPSWCSEYGRGCWWSWRETKHKFF